jgi:hypothetical protein
MSTLAEDVRYAEKHGGIFKKYRQYDKNPLPKKPINPNSTEDMEYEARRVYGKYILVMAVMMYGGEM